MDDINGSDSIEIENEKKQQVKKEPILLEENDQVEIVSKYSEPENSKGFQKLKPKK